MKKFFKILMIFIAVVALIIVGFISFIAIRGIPTYETKTIELKIDEN